MKPPECAICDERVDAIREHLVQFVAETTDELPGSENHTAWFCAAHVAQGRQWQHLPRAQALQTIRNGLLAVPAPEPTGTVFRVAANSNLFQDLVEKGTQWLAETYGVTFGVPVTTTSITYHPMDGCVPPTCPFAERATYKVATSGISLALEQSRAYWSEDKLSNSSLSAFLDVPDGKRLCVFAHSSTIWFETCRIDGELPKERLRSLAQALGLLDMLPP